MPTPEFFLSYVADDMHVRLRLRNVGISALSLSSLLSRHIRLSTLGDWAFSVAGLFPVAVEHSAAERQFAALIDWYLETP